MEEQDYRTTYELEASNWWFVGMRRMSLSLLAKPPSGGSGRVLDVGCGTGIMLQSLEAHGSSTGLDLSTTALDFCRERGLTRLVQGRGEALPFADGSFSTVSAFGVVEHIEADAQAVAEWARVLEPGGQLVLLTSAYRWLWSGHDVSNHHARRYRTREVDRFLHDAHLVKDRTSYINCFLFPPILAIRLLERIARRGRPPAPHKNTAVVPDTLNRLLVLLLAVEGWFVRRRGLPFGVSILARATKPPG